VRTLAQRLDGRQPRVLLTLGSGLGRLADEIGDPLEIGFADIGLPGPTVPGHAGRLIVGELHGVCVLVQQGRLHLYEGVDVADVTAVVRAAADVGVETFLVSNAAGGLRESMTPGDIVVLSDHINLTGHNPLVGLGGAPHFLDLTGAYDADLRRVALQAGAQLGQTLYEGVYAGLVGPTYETPAEIRMLRTLGADLVGMSTVIEVIAARAAGLRVLGLSLVTNVHRPGGTATDHAEVLEAAHDGGPRLAALVRALVPRL
jgi:purine-nucleoside phosphorylase